MIHGTFEYCSTAKKSVAKFTMYLSDGRHVSLGRDSCCLYDSDGKCIYASGSIHLVMDYAWKLEKAKKQANTVMSDAEWEKIHGKSHCSSG